MDVAGTVELLMHLAEGVPVGILTCRGYEVACATKRDWKCIHYVYRHHMYTGYDVENFKHSQ